MTKSIADHKILDTQVHNSYIGDNQKIGNMGVGVIS